MSEPPASSGYAAGTVRAHGRFEHVDADARRYLAPEVLELAGADPARATLSKRARAQLAERRESFGWLDDGATALVEEADGSWSWWTFAGLLGNAWLSAGLGLGGLPRHNLKLRLPKGISSHEAIDAIRAMDLGAVSIRPLLSTDALRGLKFSDCLPEHVALDVLERRLDGRADAAVSLAEPHVLVPRP